MVTWQAQEETKVAVIRHQAVTVPLGEAVTEQGTEGMGWMRVGSAVETVLLPVLVLVLVLLPVLLLLLVLVPLQVLLLLLLLLLLLRVVWVRPLVWKGSAESSRSSPR